MTSTLEPTPASAAPLPARRADPRVERAVRVLAPILRALGDRRDFALRFWDGRGIRAPHPGALRFTLVISRPEALRRMLLPPTDLALGEAFVRGDFDVEGDVFAAVDLGERLSALPLSAADWGRIALRAASLAGGASVAAGRDRARLTGARHSRGRDRDAIRFHYDVGNDFYALWLDRRMVYSCGYFRDVHATLDEAQLAKLDLVLDKLHLRSGQRLLDIGCGWGGLVIRAAERFDVEAIGITLSEEQARLARDRIASAGLAERCTVELLDYRDVADRLGTFDRIASVGMAEHVGESRLRDYFGAAWRSLAPGGLFLNHAISSQPARAAARGLPVEGPLGRFVRTRSFIDAYVFPDGELVPVDRMLAAAAAEGFAVHDVESLRPHYAITLRHWVRRLEAEWPRAVDAAGEAVARTWRIYMAGAARGFEAWQLDVHQALLARPRPDGTSDAPPIRTLP
ncbi:MAG: class I SAM-dependent methyltransferase [Candidatus Limnocylindria bacterium]